MAESQSDMDDVQRRDEELFGDNGSQDEYNPSERSEDEDDIDSTAEKSSDNPTVKHKAKGEKIPALTYVFI